MQGRRALPCYQYMSAIKDGRLPITLDKERHLLFSLNILDEMQDKFGGYNKLAEALSGADAIKNLKWLLTAVLNEGADESEEALTEKQVGKMVHAGNLIDIKNALFKAFSLGTAGTAEPEDVEDEDPEEDDPEDEGEKNAEGAQG